MIAPLIGSLLSGCTEARGEAAPPRVDWVSIPAGEGIVGSDRVPDQAPRRSLYLGDFALMRSEVSLRDFERFAAAGGYGDRALWSEAGEDWLADHPGAAEASAHRALGRAPEHPVLNVSYYEAEAYCAWIGGRLPTEWEWERGARGDDGRRYPWGDEADPGEANWNHAGKVEVIHRVTTVPVSGGSAPSPYGLLHMAGNAWEWTSSGYGQDPQHPPEHPTWQVVRGGSWMNLWSYCSTTWREPVRPEDQRITVGFRCAR